MFAVSRRSGAPLPRLSSLDRAKLQPAEASIQSLLASLVSQPSLIFQIVGKTIPVGGVIPPEIKGPPKDRGPWPSNLGPEAVGSWTEDLAPGTSVLGTRPSTAIANNVTL
jgi:hypothetical protein